MSVNREIKQLQQDYAAKRIDRRQLFKALTALGIGGVWLSAIEKGAFAAPVPSARTLRGRGQEGDAPRLAAGP